MSLENTAMAYVNINLCKYRSDQFQLCADNLCIARTSGCKPTTLADQVIQKDVTDAISVPIMVAIAAASVLACVIIFLLLYIFMQRRSKNNTCTESQSATKPLRKCYVTSDVNAPEKSEGRNERARYYYEKYITECANTGNYIPVAIYDPEILQNTKNHVELGDVEDVNKQRDKSHKQFRDNLVLPEGFEVYNEEIDNSMHCIGSYTFKPRSNYIKRDPSLTKYDINPHTHPVINSYKHCSGKNILMSSLSFEMDPENFSSKFATDLLCSSTPRQHVRHLMKENGNSNDPESNCLKEPEDEF